MITVTVLIDDVDYVSFAEKIIPMGFNRLKNKKDKSFKDSVLLLLRKPIEDSVK